MFKKKYIKFICTKQIPGGCINKNNLYVITIKDYMNTDTVGIIEVGTIWKYRFKDNPLSRGARLKSLNKKGYWLSVDNETFKKCFVQVKQKVKQNKKIKNNLIIGGNK